MNPSATIRQIAALAARPDVRELLEQLAAQLELQHNTQNNLFAAAIGGTDLSLMDAIAQLRDEVGARLDGYDARDREILSELNARLDHIERSMDVDPRAGED